MLLNVQIPEIIASTQKQIYDFVLHTIPNLKI